MKALDIGTFSMRFDFISMKTEIEIVVKSFFFIFNFLYFNKNLMVFIAICNMKIEQIKIIINYVKEN